MTVMGHNINDCDTTTSTPIMMVHQLFTEKYTSRVVMRRPKEVAVKVVHSRLFTSLDSTWRFLPGKAPNTTLIDFSVEFEVKNLLAAQAMDVFFDEVSLQQVHESEKVDKIRYIRVRFIISIRQ